MLSRTHLVFTVKIYGSGQASPLAQKSEDKMSFAEWTKKTKLFRLAIDAAYYGDDDYCDKIHRACRAAYKAGERRGRKDELEFNNELSKQTLLSTNQN